MNFAGVNQHDEVQLIVLVLLEMCRQNLKKNSGVLP